MTPEEQAAADAEAKSKADAEARARADAEVAERIKEIRAKGHKIFSDEEMKEAIRARDEAKKKTRELEEAEAKRKAAEQKEREKEAIKSGLPGEVIAQKDAELKAALEKLAAQEAEADAFRKQQAEMKEQYLGKINDPELRGLVSKLPLVDVQKLVDKLDSIEAQPLTGRAGAADNRFVWDGKGNIADAHAQWLRKRGLAS